MTANTSVREYAILYVGGKGKAGATIGGGNVLLNAGQHALDGPEHTGQLPADRVSIEDTAALYAATDAEAALAEVGQQVIDHLADTSDAHDASAVSFVPTGTIAATDVQAAIAEVASEAALTVKDEGSALATSATTLDFVGAGVTASGTGATKTITIAAGGTSASDTALWRPVMDGAGAVLTDGATGEAIMAYGAA